MSQSIGMLIPRFCADVFRTVPAERLPGRKFVATKFAKCKHEPTRELKSKYH